jgi:hypothetical protein
MHIWVSACVRVGTTVFSRYLGAISCCISRRKGSGTHARKLQRNQTRDSLLDLLALGACRDGRLERLRHFVRVSQRAAICTGPQSRASRTHTAGSIRQPSPPCTNWGVRMATPARPVWRPLQRSAVGDVRGRDAPVLNQARASPALDCGARGVRRRAAACGGVRRQQGAPVGDARALHARSLRPLNWWLWYRGVKGPGRWSDLLRLMTDQKRAL